MVEFLRLSCLQELVLDISVLGSEATISYDSRVFGSLSSRTRLRQLYIHEATLGSFASVRLYFLRVKQKGVPSGPIYKIGANY